MNAEKEKYFFCDCDFKKGERANVKFPKYCFVAVSFTPLED